MIWSNRWASSGVMACCVAGTAWGAFNAVTAWSDHGRRVLGSKQVTKAERRFETSLLDVGPAFKRRALDLALKL